MPRPRRGHVICARRGWQQMGLSSGWRVAIQKEEKGVRKEIQLEGKKRFGVERRRDFYQERASR